MDDSADDSIDNSTDDSANEDDDHVNYDFREIWPAVQKEFQFGSTMEEAFRNVYCKLRQRPPSFSIRDWLEEFYAKDYYRYGMRESFDYDLRSAIAGQHLKFTKTMYFSDGWNFIEFDAILYGRFMFVVSRAIPKSFSIIDSFTGERRELQGPIHELEGVSSYFPVWIDEGRVLMQYYGSEDVHSVSLRLLKVDFQEAIWAILDTVVCDIGLSQITLDSTDNNKFMMCPPSFFSPNTSILRGQIVDDRIRMDEHRIEIQDKLYYPKLEDGKIHAFRHLRNEEWHFCDYILDSGSARMINSVRSAFHRIGLDMLCNYLWVKDKLYLSDFDWDFLNWFIIVSFDSITRVWSRTKLAGSSLSDRLVPNILAVDDDEVLTISTVEEDHYPRQVVSIRKSVHRFPMRKPDKLCYLAWLTIRRGALLFGSDLYEKLAPRLPFNSEFRSFLESG